MPPPLSAGLIINCLLSESSFRAFDSDVVRLGKVFVVDCWHKKECQHKQLDRSFGRRDL